MQSSRGQSIGEPGPYASPRWCRRSTGREFRVHNYHTNKILQTKKLKRSIISILVQKTSKDVKSTIDDTVHFEHLLLSPRKTKQDIFRTVNNYSVKLRNT